MTTHLTLPQVAEFLRSHDNYLLLSHRRPDGDAVGTNAALCLALRAMGKRAWVYPNPQFTPKFAPYLEGLAGTGNVPGGGSQTVVSCDIAAPNLFPFGMEEARVDLAIDHHGTNTGFAACTYTDETRAACGEIVVELLCLLGVEMTKAMAEALYVAIATDTGCFRYVNVTANTFRCAAACLAAGAEVYPINRTFFEIKRRPRLQLEAYLIAHMEFFAQGKVAVSAIPRQLIEQLGLTEDDIDDISGFGRTVEGVELAVMLREVENGQGKISLRTGPGWNAAKICARLGGGGHPGAAGAGVSGGIPAARAAILAAIGEELAL